MQTAYTTVITEGDRKALELTPTGRMISEKVSNFAHLLSHPRTLFWYDCRVETANSIFGAIMLIVLGKIALWQITVHDLWTWRSWWLLILIASGFLFQVVIVLEIGLGIGKLLGPGC